MTPARATAKAEPAVCELALGDIQGNLVRGYPFTKVAHYFGRIGEANARAWRSLFGKLAGGALGGVTTAALWDPTNRPDGAMNVAISYAGLVALGADPGGAIKDAFPAFADGMEPRAVALGDDPKAARYAEWKDRHVWLSVHGMDADALARRRTSLEALAKELNLALSAPLYASAIVDPDGGRREPFGFRDGIANPVLQGDPLLERTELPGNGKYDATTKTWSPIAAGEFILGQPNEQRQNVLPDAAPAELLKNGTFAVFRDLEQHVERFKEYLRACQEDFGYPADFFARKMIGRSVEGDPLAAPGAVNDFTYEGDRSGSGCPLGAHVRRANPRVTGERRLIRRGVPYAHADGTRGLYFVAYNASIEAQFEFVQKVWMNGRAGAVSHSTDPVGSSKSGNMVIEGDVALQRPPVLLRDMPSFVTCRGGEYYFVPGLGGLRVLAR